MKLLIIALTLSLTPGLLACGAGNEEESETDADGDGDADGDADGDGDADREGDADGDSDADGDADADGDSDADGDADADGDGDADGDADADDASPCTPRTGDDTEFGSASINVLAVVGHDDRDTTVHANGSLIFLNDATCVVVDSVEISGGEMSVRLEEEISTEGLNWSVAGPAGSDLEALCDDDATRFQVLSVQIRGRMDGGTFEANDEIGVGALWPPNSVVTCGHNLEVFPLVGYGLVEDLYSSLSFAYPDPELSISSIDPTVHIIYGTDSYTVSSTDTTGWSYSLVMSDDRLNVFLDASDDQLGVSVCPGSGIPQPIFIARVSGMSNGQTFMSEFLVNDCDRF